MTSARIRAVGFLIGIIIFSSLTAYAAEPLSGRWLLVSQEIAGQKTAVEQLLLRINPAGQQLEFAYSVPVNDIQFVSLPFSAPLDGTQTDVTNSSGQKIGTVKITKLRASSYKIVLEGHNRPTASGTMTVSPDGKTLKSESESSVSGRPAVRVFDDGAKTYIQMPSQVQNREAPVLMVLGSDGKGEMTNYRRATADVHRRSLV